MCRWKVLLESFTKLQQYGTQDEECGWLNGGEAGFVGWDARHGCYHARAGLVGWRLKPGVTTHLRARLWPLSMCPAPCPLEGRHHHCAAGSDRQQHQQQHTLSHALAPGAARCRRLDAAPRSAALPPPQPASQASQANQRP